MSVASRLRFHPSTRRLRHWLDGGPDAEPAVDEHVLTCDRCANRLEDLAHPLPELGSALSQSLSTPDDLVSRLGVRMNESIRNREDLALFFELMGVSFATVRTLMEEES